jgi:negative regulator of genetic competence, sporulation and motility
MHPADVFRLRKKTFQITSAMYNAKDEYFVVVKAIEDQMFEKSRDRCSSYVPEYPSPKCASRTRARTPEYAQNGGTDRLLPSPT